MAIWNELTIIVCSHLSRVLLHKNTRLTSSVCDVVLSQLGHISGRNYVSDHPDVITEAPQYEIIKEFVQRPLYFNRQWRQNPIISYTMEEQLDMIRAKLRLE